MKWIVMLSDTQTAVDPSAEPESLSLAVGLLPLQASKWFAIEQSENLSVLSDRFRADAEAFAAMVTHRGIPRAVISREALALHLSQLFGNSLFRSRPIEFTLEHWHQQMLMCDHDEPLAWLVHRMLARSAANRYEPIVLRKPDDTYTLLDAHHLMLEQCSALEQTLDRLRDQRAATIAAEQERESLQRQLLDASRQAGRAEVASGLLHNVGNVLNSVNVSISVLQRTLENSRLSGLERTIDLLNEHAGDLGSFFRSDEKAPHVVPFLERLLTALREEQQAQSIELSRLAESVEHIKQVVHSQQRYGRSSAFLEMVRPQSIIDEAIRLNAASFDRHNVRVHCRVDPVPSVSMDKHKVLQILVNLISNAKNATKPKPANERFIEIHVERVQNDSDSRLRFSVTDNGIGISDENLGRVFQHGFTTRPDGNGFGLHSAANAAGEMGGTLKAASDGPGHGATFTLEIPLQTQQAKAA